MLERGLLPDFSSEALAELARLQTQARTLNGPADDPNGIHDMRGALEQRIERVIGYKAMIGDALQISPLQVVEILLRPIAVGSAHDVELCAWPTLSQQAMDFQRVIQPLVRANEAKIDQSITQRRSAGPDLLAIDNMWDRCHISARRNAQDGIAPML